jgi:hypothetical protein
MIAIVIYISCMHKTTIYLEEELYQRIRRLAQASGKTQASVIREALAAYTGGPPGRPRSIGMGSGPRDLSERVDDRLDGFGEDP